MRAITIIQTAKDTNDRLTEKKPLLFIEGEESERTIQINDRVTYQTVIGFGGAFTEAAAYTLSKIPLDKRQEIIKSYFHPEEGLGYTMGRTHINSCDFSLKNYTYVEEYDTELSTFSIEREHHYVIPLMKDAMKERGGELLLVASPWSPPAWMKTNGEMNHGGKLKEEYKHIWARYYAKYIKAMRKEGIDVWAITVQNEPDATQVWDSCRYSAEEERDFVKHYLGPTLHEEGLEDVKIIIWDHNRDVILERATVAYSDPEAAQYIWGTGVHWYVSEEFENLAKVHEKFPHKHLIFTEGCVEGGVKLGAWDTGERYGRNMIGDFNNYLEGWIDWNLVLDETGGPNHVGNFCDAPIIVDTKTKTVHYNSSYYYIGHFSKFVKPGAVRIGCSIENPNVQAVAFKNKDGQMVLIAMNETDYLESMTISCSDGKASTELPPHSITTFIW